MSLETVLQVANLAILPALGYLIALERRLVRLETQLQVVLNHFQRGERHEQA